MLVEQVLSELVRIPSVARRPNGAIVDHVRACLDRHAVASTVLAGPEGDRFNLFATIGPADWPGYVLSGHLDVVPAEEPSWTSDPFELRRDGERLVGRGAVDMKGFVACVLAAVPGLVARQLARPIHIALSYDEEVGCVGVRHLVDRLPSLCRPPLGCIVGEPTGMRPVLRHKGKAALCATVHGRSAHSSRPDLGVNAIYHAAEVVAAVRGRADRLDAEGPFNPLFAPPHSTLQVGEVGPPAHDAGPGARRLPAPGAAGEGGAGGRDGAIHRRGVGDRQLGIGLAVARPPHRHRAGAGYQRPLEEMAARDRQGVRIKVEHRGSRMASTAGDRSGAR